MALFIHILGAVTWFSALALTQRGGQQLRKAESAEHALMWLGILKPTGGMFAGAGVFLLATGLYMTSKLWTYTTSWVLTAFITLILLLALGGGIVGRTMAKIAGLTAAAPTGPIPAEAKSLIDQQGLWVLIGGLQGAAIGLVWLMTNKPGWVASIGTIVGLFAVGAVIAMMGLRKSD